MRTIRFSVLFLLIAAAAPTYAQPTHRPRPNGLTEKEYQAKKKELRHKIRELEAEYARYDEVATGFEGIWTVQGNQTARRRSGDSSRVIGLTGRLVLTRQSDKGLFEIEGRVTPEGSSTSKPWKGKGAVAADGNALNAEYSAKSIAGKGTTTYTLQSDGSLKMTFVREAESSGAEGRGELVATRELGSVDKAGLEKRLFDVNYELQFLRYERPTPLSYSARSRKLRVRFTPTVEWDPNGVEQQVVDMIDAAKSSIDLCVFEFALMRVAEALVRAKKRGVTVRMVYDDREEHQPALQVLKDNEIPVRSDKRTALMHNKFMVIDYGKPTELTWSGSTNLAPGGIYIADNHAMTFKNNKIAEIYTTEFEEMFTDGKFGPRSPQNTSHEWIKLDNVSKVQIYFAPEDDPMDRLIEVVKGARKTIRIMAFAFTSEALFTAIKERMLSPDKVKVEGVFESRHAGWKDIKIGPLHALGAKVRYDENPNAMHHKVLIIDDKIVISGSFNFTDSATVSNDENMIVLDSRGAAHTFKREFRRIMGTTDPDDPRIATSGMDVDGIAEMIDRTTDDNDEED